MEPETTFVAGVPMDAHQPTSLSFAALKSWVIWQFTTRQGQGLCGAVHPSLPGHGWYPALVFPKDKRVLVYAHQGMRYATPEEASEGI